MENPIIDLERWRETKLCVCVEFRYAPSVDEQVVGIIKERLPEVGKR